MSGPDARHPVRLTWTVHEDHKLDFTPDQWARFVERLDDGEGVQALPTDLSPESIAKVQAFLDDPDNNAEIEDIFANTTSMHTWSGSLGEYEPTVWVTR